MRTLDRKMLWLQGFVGYDVGQLSQVRITMYRCIEIWKVIGQTRP